MEAWWRIQMSRCQWVQQRSLPNSSQHRNAQLLLEVGTDEICVMWCYIFKAAPETFLCWQLQMTQKRKQFDI